MKMTRLTTMKPWVLIFLAIRNFLDGAEEYFITPTAWYYIKSLGGSQKFLGMVLSIYGGAAVVAGPILGKFADQFGYIKLIVIFCYVLKVTGNIIYSIPVSIYCPLIGRALSGFSIGSTGILYGQLVLYTSDRSRPKAFIFINGMYCLGTVCGPALSSLLVFDANVFGWKIGPGNSPGVILAIIWSISLVVSFWLPKEFGTNIELDKTIVSLEEDSTSSSEDSDLYLRPSKLPPKHTIFCVFYVIFLGQFFPTIVTFYTPLLAQERFHLQFLDVKLLFLASSILSLVLFLTLYLATGCFNELKQACLAFVMQIIAISLLLYFAVYWGEVYWYDSYLLIPYIGFGLQNFIFAIGCSLLARITDPTMAGFYQGSSFSVDHLGFVFGRIVSGFIFTRTSLLLYCVGLSLLWLTGTIWFSLEYNHVLS